MSKFKPSKRQRTQHDIALVTDAEQLAKAAKLRHVVADEPGIKRRRSGKKFSYVGPDGKPIHDEATLARIKSLVIPPMWTRVWICADADGHIQVTARDAKRRKQYRYHPRWMEVTGQTKFDRMILFGEHLPEIRACVQHDLSHKGLPREKVLAAVVALLGATFIRVGNDEYARTNDSYGLTTMEDEHVQIKGATMHFEFRGKSGKEHAIDLRDPRLARVVQRARDVPGHRLFQYYDEHQHRHAVTSADVNAYLNEITTHHFTAKDFRTWGGTLLAREALAGMDTFENQKWLKQNLMQMYKSVAEHLGNTVVVCKKYYVHPAIVELYQRGELQTVLSKHYARSSNIHSALNPSERALMNLLHDYRAQSHTVH